MTRTFRTMHTEAQPMLAIRETSTMEELPERLGPLFGEVAGFLQRNGEQPAGMPFTIYHEVGGDTTLDFESGMPVASPVAGEGRIRAGELPAARVAAVTHLGPYDTLGGTWSALMDWMESQGLQPAGAPWEVYVTDPGAEPDQSKWRTDIFFPVR